jgi:hypothetical protein
MLAFSLPTRAAASTTVKYRQESYTPSAEALAAALRFRDVTLGKKFADLEVVIKELTKDEGASSAGGQAEYRAISRQQLLDLLGPPPFDDEKGTAIYRHTYGYTYFYFENDTLKDIQNVSEPILWYAYPQQSFPKRMWYKAVRFAHRLKRLLS